MVKKTSKRNLNTLQKDALHEISNITTGNAKTALSKIINKSVEVSIPKAELLKKQELAKSLGGPKKMVMAIYCRITGDLTGQALFFFRRESAMQLVDLLLGKEGNQTRVLDTYSESAFGEMANIFTGSYLNALSELFGLRILPGVPVVATDYVGPIVDYVWGRIKNPQERMFCFTTQIKVDKHDIDGDFVFMLDSESYELVIDNLETNYGVKKKKSKKSSRSNK